MERARSLMDTKLHEAFHLVTLSGWSVHFLVHLRNVGFYSKEPATASGRPAFINVHFPLLAPAPVVSQQYHKGFKLIQALRPLYQ
jgi:hypothetical protein